MATTADFRSSAASHLADKRRRSFTRALIYHLVVGSIGLFMFYPILWMFSSSVKPNTEIWTTVNSLIPSQVVFENYADGFARVKFAGNNIWFTIILMTLMLPGEVMLIPQYIIFNRVLGWVPGFLPLIVPALGGSAFFIFMIMQVIRGIPVAMDEAAMISGAGQFGIFRHAIPALLKPAIITATIFSFYWSWVEFLSPLIYLTKLEMYTVSIALRNFSDATAATNWGAIFAMLSLSLVPVFIIIVFFQQYIVEGISTSGLKG